MSIQRYRGLLAVILWQTVPSPVAFDSTGRIQGALGFGGGQYEQVRVSCDGEDLGSSGTPAYPGRAASRERTCVRPRRGSAATWAQSNDPLQQDPQAHHPAQRQRVDLTLSRCATAYRHQF